MVLTYSTCKMYSMYIKTIFLFYWTLFDFIGFYFTLGFNFRLEFTT